MFYQLLSYSEVFGCKHCVVLRIGGVVLKMFWCWSFLYKMVLSRSIAFYLYWPFAKCRHIDVCITSNALLVVSNWDVLQMSKEASFISDRHKLRCWHRYIKVPPPTTCNHEAIQAWIIQVVEDEWWPELIYGIWASYVQVKDSFSKRNRGREELTKCKREQ